MAKIAGANPTLGEVKEDVATQLKLYLYKAEDYSGIPCGERLELNRAPVWRDLEVYYEYAFKARMPAGCDIENWGNEGGFNLLEQLIVGPSPAHDMINLASARRALDSGGKMAIKQIALLAGMTEKSVRNAIHVIGDQRLGGASTDKSDTLVENYEAKCWLQGRRGFAPTVFANFDERQPERLSHAEISKYIHDRVYALYGGADDEDYVTNAANQLGWDDPEKLRRIFVSATEIPPPDCEPLANLMKVDAAWFTEQVMRALFPRQMELALKSALHSKPQMHEPNNEGTGS